MTDIATLGLAVDSDPVEKASTRLERLNLASTLAEKGVEKLVDKFKELALTYLSFDALKSASEKFIQETAKADRQVAQLNATLKSTGGAAGVTAKQLEQIAANLSKTTTFSKGTTIAAEALFLTFTHIKSDVYPQMIELTQDLSTALGSDLSSAALVVGKALNDPVNGLTALGKAGVQFDDSTKVLIKNLVETGKTAEAQRVILDRLQKSFGGSAVAARSTLGGALQSLGNAFNSLFEIDNSNSEPFRDALEGLISKLEDPAFIAAVQNFGIALFNGLAAVMPYVQKLMDLAGLVNDQAQGKKPINATNYGTLQPGKGAGSIMFSDETLMHAVLSGKLGQNADFGLDGSNAQYKFGSMGDFFNDATSANVANMNAPPPKPPKPDRLIQQDEIDKAAAMQKAYDGVTRSAKQQIEANKLNAETLGMSSEAAARLGHQQDLLNAAANANVKLTDKQRSELNDLADQMAKTEEYTRQLTDAYNFGRDALEGFFSDMSAGLRAGKSLWESFGDAATNVLNKLEDKALNMAADGIWNAIFGAFSGGITGGGSGAVAPSTFDFAKFLNPAIHHAGGTVGLDGANYSRSFPAAIWNNAPRYHSGGIAGMAPDEVPAILQKGERVIPRGGTSNQNGGHLEIEVTHRVVNGSLVPDMVRIAGQVSGQQIKTTVPAMIKNGAPPAVASASYDRTLTHK